MVLRENDSAIIHTTDNIHETKHALSVLKLYEKYSNFCDRCAYEQALEWQNDFLEIRDLEEGILIYPEGSKNRTEYENLINKRKQEFNALKKDRDDFFGGTGFSINSSSSSGNNVKSFKELVSQ